MTFAQRTWFAIGAVAAAVALALLLVFAFHVFLLIFAGILLAAVLRGLSLYVMRSGLSYSVSFMIVVLLLTVTIFGGGWLLGSRIAGQVDELIGQLGPAQEKADKWLSQFAWGRTILQHLPSYKDVLSGGMNMGSGLNVLFASVTGVFTTTFLVVMFALYFAADPKTYEQGMILLIPPQRRQRAGEVLRSLPDTLCRWALGQAASMTIIGLGAAIGLWCLGIPLPLTLGVFAGLATFVPNIGGIVGVIPPALLALQQGPTQMVYVLIFFLILQGVESNLVTPLIQQQAVSVPPGLLLGAQLLMGSLAGLLGLALATPLAAVGLVLVRKLYIVDSLGDHSLEDSQPGQQ